MYLIVPHKHLVRQILPILKQGKGPDGETFQYDVRCEVGEQEVGDGHSVLRLRGGGGNGEENTSDDQDGEENSSDDEHDEDKGKVPLHSESDGAQERSKRRSCSSDGRLETCGDQMVPTILFHSTPFHARVRFKNDKSTEKMKDLTNKEESKKEKKKVEKGVEACHETKRPKTDDKVRACKLQSKWYIKWTKNQNQEQEEYLTGM